VSSSSESRVRSMTTGADRLELLGPSPRGSTVLSLDAAIEGVPILVIDRVGVLVLARVLTSDTSRSSITLTLGAISVALAFDASTFHCPSGSMVT
jgi:hypothetical protein